MYGERRRRGGGGERHLTDSLHAPVLGVGVHAHVDVRVLYHRADVHLTRAGQSNVQVRATARGAWGMERGVRVG